MLKEFSYVIKLVVQNSQDGSLFYITKEFFDNIQIGEDDYFVPFPISPSQTDEALKKELEKYAVNNNLDTNSLQVISKEISSNSDAVDIYFDESESDNIHNYNPDINIEFIPTIYKPSTPQFFKGSLDGEDTILWSWEAVNGCAYRVIDESGDVVANIGVGNSMFVEDSIEVGKSYIRRIIAYNSDGDSEPSEYAIVTLEGTQEEEKELNQATDTGEYTSSDIVEYASSEQTSKYFKSGIGDNFDLLVEKTDEAYICERFQVHSGIKAFNNVEQRIYTPIEVEYYIRATGDEIKYGDPDSSFKLRVIPWPVVSTMISIHSVVSEPITFDIEYSMDVFYQSRRTPNVKLELKGAKSLPNELPVGKEIHITLKDENGDIPDSDVVFSVTGGSATISSDGMLKATAETEVEVTAYYKYYDLPISKTILFSESATTPTFSTTDDFKDSNMYQSNIIDGYRLCKKILPYKRSFTINGIKEKEKLANLESYIRNSDNDILSSPLNTIQVISAEKVYGSNDDIDTTIEENNIYVTTSRNERIYVYRKIYDSKLSIDQKNSLKIIDPDKLIYRNKYNTIYQGNAMPSTTIEYIDVPNSITVYDDEGNIAPMVISNKYPVLNAHINTPSENTIISGVTNKNVPACVFSISSLFSKLSGESYILEIVELQIDGEVKYTTPDSDNSSVSEGNKFIYVKNKSNASLSVTGVKSKKYEPFVKESNVFTCTVNGKKPYVYDYDGKENYVTYAPVFEFKYETRNTEYEVVAFNKAEKRIDAEFENGHKYRTTKRNGDVLIISSSDYEVVNDFRSQIVSESTSEEFILTDGNETIFTTYLYNPRFNRTAEQADLNNCEIFIKSSNPNISVSSDISSIDFTLPKHRDEIRIPITFKAKIISVSQTSWSPIINSGYYFINNKEYYLYGESKLTGVFGKEKVATSKYFFISVIANIESKTNSLPITRLLSGATSFASGTFNKTALNGETLVLNSVQAGGKRVYYDEGTYITDEIVLGSELSNLTIELDGEYLDNVEIYVSMSNGVGWTEWSEIPNGFKVESEEYIQRFKVKLKLLRLVDQDIDYSESTSISIVGDIKADGYSSNNMVIQTGLITLSDVSKSGFYESPIYDVAEASYYVFIEPQSLSDIEGKYELYIAFSKTKDFSKSNYARIDKRAEVGDNKYYRYKIVLPANSKFGFNELKTTTTYTSTSQISISPIIKSIETSSIPQEWVFAGTITKPILCELKSDSKWKYVTSYNVLDMIYPDIAIAGIRHPRVQNIIIETMDSDVEVQYDASKDGRILARTKTVATETVDSKYLALDENHYGYLTPVPKLGAPVVLMYEDIPLMPVSYAETEDELLDYVEEVFTYSGQNIAYMMYNDIDQTTVLAQCEEEIVNVEKVINNKIIFDTNKLSIGDLITFRYKVKYSFGCNLQYSHDIAKVVVYLDALSSEDEYKKITAYCETSDDGLCNVSEIEINPMYNTNNTGFIYLSDTDQIASKINLAIDKTEFKASIVEDVYFTVCVLDALGNPVSSIPVRIVTLYGKVKMDNNVTNKFGIVTARYIHPTFECEDVITASIASTSISDSVTIGVDKDSKFTSLTSIVEDSKYVINNGQSIVIRARLFEDDLTPLVGKEIVVEMSAADGVITKNALTNSSGECSFEIIPEVNLEDEKSKIVVSHLSITSDILIKVVDRS